MRLSLLLVLAPLAVLFQSLSGPCDLAGGAVPGLTWVLAAWSAMTQERLHGLIVAAALGALLDAASLDPLGANTVSLLLASHLLSRATAAGWAERPLSRAGILSAAMSAYLALRRGLIWSAGAGTCDLVADVSSGAVALLAVLSAIPALGQPLRPRPRASLW